MHRRLASALKEKTVEMERRSSASEQRARVEVELAERAARLAREEADAAQLRASRMSQETGARLVDDYP